MSAGERRYSDEEFAEILRRAGELQASRRDAASAPEVIEPSTGEALTRPPGMSLDEISSIAREVGIDPALVRRAATTLEADEVAFAETSPDRFLLKRSVPGTMKRDDLARILTAVRDASGMHGETVSGVPGVEWKTGDVVKTVVSAASLDGQTELRVAVDATGARILSHLFPGLAGLLTGVAVGATLEPGLAGGIAVMAGSIGTGLGAGHLIWKRVLSRVRRDAQRLFRAGAGALPPGDGPE